MRRAASRWMTTPSTFRHSASVFSIIFFSAQVTKFGSTVARLADFGNRRSFFLFRLDPGAPSPGTGTAPKIHVLERLRSLGGSHARTCTSHCDDGFVMPDGPRGRQRRR